MKRLLVKKTPTIISLAATGTLFTILMIGVPITNTFRPQITNFLCGTSKAKGGNSEENLAESDKLCKDIEADSIVMLKNENNTLPLEMNNGDDTNINVFGYGATDEGFLLKGVGSGSSSISESKKMTLQEGLEEYGFVVNQDVLDEYTSKSLANSDLKDKRSSNPNVGDVYNLAEISRKHWEDSGLLDDAKDFSNTALFVISRDGGENVGEIPQKQKVDTDRSYLEISKAEQENLDMLKDNFDNVIVILNTTNTMHTGFLKDEKIDACISVGLTGQSGAEAIGRILSGEASPSGRTTDIMTYSHEYDPSFANNTAHGTICYQEDIYYGYKWYETANTENYFNNVSNSYGTKYDGVVQYPFGYGLSYTEFSWTLKSVTLPNNSKLTKDSNVEIKIEVKNTGKVAGKDVVEMYYSAPYTKGEIEKSSINLLDFGKTIELQPGDSQTLTLNFSSYDLASYDCYDKNNNGNKTYELDSGNYEIKFMNNSHQINKMSSNTLNYSVDTDIAYLVDPVSGKEIKNRFTGDDAYLNMPIDGSGSASDGKANINTTYLTRNNFASTFPKSTVVGPHNDNVNKMNQKLYDDPYKDLPAPTFDSKEKPLSLTLTKNGKTKPNKTQLTTSQDEIEVNDELLEELKDYSNPKWETLLNQMTKDEVKNLIQYGGFKTIEIESIGKPRLYDNDGPAGFNDNAQTGNWNGGQTSQWTAYPSEASMGCSWNKTLLLSLGLSMGKEGNATALTGWYAPGVNLHRSAYTARNYEYYSEDPVLSGKLAANVIKGAKINGLTCYLKHFACSEEGPNPGDVNTWLTEQNLRENYLRPFEIAVKEGNANAMMSAFNRVGGVWAGANYALLTSVLRNEWGFKGTVISDYYGGGGGELGHMNIRQGVRAGNDFMLCGNGVGSGFTGALDMSDKVDQIAARESAKNIIYSWVDTNRFNKNFDASELEGITKIDANLPSRGKVFEWWIMVYAIISVLGGLAVDFFIWQLVENILANRKPKLVSNSNTPLNITDDSISNNKDVDVINSDETSCSLDDSKNNDNKINSDEDTSINEESSTNEDTSINEESSTKGK